jgi:hypothetical protein
MQSKMTISSKALLEGGGALPKMHGMTFTKMSLKADSDEETLFVSGFKVLSAKEAKTASITVPKLTYQKGNEGKYYAMYKNVYIVDKTAIKKVSELFMDGVPAFELGKPEEKMTLSAERAAAKINGADKSVELTCKGSFERGPDYKAQEVSECTSGGSEVKDVYVFPTELAPGATTKDAIICDWRCNYQTEASAGADAELKQDLFYRNGWLEYMLNFASTSYVKEGSTEAQSEEYKSGEMFAFKQYWTKNPTAGWTSLIVLAVFFNCFQSWMSGMVSKVLSSLVKNILSAVATAMIVYTEKLICSSEAMYKLADINLLCGVCCVFVTAIIFALAPKAPKPEPKPEPAPVEEEDEEDDDEDDDDDDDTDSSDEENPANQQARK